MAAVLGDDLQIQDVQRHLQSGGQRRARDDVRQVDAQMHERLGNGRPHARQHHLRPQQADGADGLDQMLRRLRVDRRHAHDVHQGHGRIGFHDAVEQPLHELLRALAVQRADQRRDHHALPDLHDRRG